MATTFNDIIFAQTAFQQALKMLTPLNAFSTDISSDVDRPGSAVVVPLFGAIATTTFDQTANSGFPLEGSGGLISAITVTLDKRRITTVDVTHQQLAESSNVGRWDQYAAQLANSACTTVLQDLFSLVTISNFGAAIITTSSANYKMAQLTKARQYAIKNGVPEGARSFIVNTDCEVGMLSDTNLVLALNRGQNETITEGKLGRAIGFDIYSSDLLPTNSISLVGFACGKDGIVFGMRSLGQYLPPENYQAIEVLQDPKTGISMLYTRHFNPGKGKWFLNLHTLYGYSVGVTKHVNVFTTPDT